MKTLSPLRADFHLYCPSHLPGRLKVEVVVVEEVEGGPGGKVQVTCKSGCQADHLTHYLTGLHLGRSHEPDTVRHLISFPRIDSVKFTGCPVPEQPMSTLFEVCYRHRNEKVNRST